MNVSLPASSLIAAILVLVSSATGCITTGVVNKANDRYPTTANIRAIKGAATLNDDLYLQLDVESRKFASTSTVILRIPLGDIGEGHMSADATSFSRDGLQLRTPYIGTFEPSTTLPAECTPLVIHNVPNDPTTAPNDLELEMEDWIYSRPPGIYVMVVPYFSEDTESKLTSKSLPPGTVPRNGYLLVVRRDADHAPRKERMSGFSEYAKKRRSLLLLTPLTVVADIITCPFQLLYMWFGD